MEKFRVHCNSCDSYVWHDVISHETQIRFVPIWGFNQKQEAQIIRCRGCDEFTFRYLEHPFEFQDPADKAEEHFYPDRSHTKRKRKFVRAPMHIWELYRQVVEAQDRKLTILSAAGLRSLIEAVVSDKIDKSKYKSDINSKIEALTPYFDPGVIAVLHELRKMGNAALHAQQQSEHLDIHRALYVIEGILDYFYNIKDSAEVYSSMKEEGKKKPRKARKGAGA